MRKGLVVSLFTVCCALLGICVRDEKDVNPDQSSQELDPDLAPQHHDAGVLVSTLLQRQLEGPKITYQQVWQSAGNTAICDESGRVNFACGNCGPDWGDQSACEQECNAESSCMFYVFFDDLGCRGYSRCVAIWNGDVKTSIWSKVFTLKYESTCYKVIVEKNIMQSNGDQSTCDGSTEYVNSLGNYKSTKGETQSYSSGSGPCDNGESRASILTIAEGPNTSITVTESPMCLYTIELMVAKSERSPVTKFSWSSRAGPKLIEQVRGSMKMYYKNWYKAHTEFIPYYAPTTVRGRNRYDPCNIFICNEAKPSIGVGRREGLLGWIIATMVPLISVLTIIIGVSYGASEPRGCLDVKPKSAIAAMFGAMLFNFSTSYTLYLMASRPSCMYAFLLLLSTLSANVCQIATLRFSSVEFAWPDFSPSPFLQMLSMMRFVIYYLLDDVLKIFNYVYTSVHNVLFADSTLSSVFLSCITTALWDIAPCLFFAFQPPSLASFVFLCFQFRLYLWHFFYFGDMTGSCGVMPISYLFPVRYAILVYMALTCFVNHYRDRCFVAAIGYLSFNFFLIAYLCLHAQHADSGAKASIVLAWITALTMVIIGCVCCVLMRYRRVLPVVLRDAKYIRISYFFKMQRQGQLITRCQDVPAAAFGNVAKARIIIIISHRWLDRYACDVLTESYPQGVRLTTMCQRFDRFFPSSWHAFLKLLSTPISAIMAAAISNLYSDHDILVFFDFMSLPQIGKLPDGTVIERTAEEHLLFHSVLPAMGSLYTMYPVLICPEVAGTAVPYFSSGWCFCEWSQAHLSNKLSPYSISQEESGGIGLDDVVDARVVAWTSALSSSPVEFMRELDLELQNKIFFHESDRDIVQSIARTTQTRRMLVEAVCQQDTCNVQKLLGHGLMQSINDAVDDQSLDTLLHLAMRLPSKEIVNALIQAGADVDSLNWRGDTPSELFMINRAWLPCLRA